MKRQWRRWLTAGKWGWMYFLMDGFVGQLWYLSRQLFVIFWMVVAWVIAERLGIANGLYVWLTVPPIALGIFFLLWASMLGWLTLFYPLPPCRHGICRGFEGYYWPEGLLFGRWKWGMYIYRCKCSHEEYWRKGKRFLRILEGGKEVPYMVLAGFRDWQPDPEKASSKDKNEAGGTQTPSE